MASHAKWMVVYQAPADDYKFKHVAHVNTVNDEAFARLVFKQNSPDARIISCEPYTDPDQVFAKAEQLRTEGGPGWQPMHGADFALTKRQVRRLSTQYADIAKRAGTIVDARGNPMFTLDERSALLEDKPPTAAHVVADELTEARMRGDVEAAGD